jgi:serine phosphatase RsbU (regulator of sigma subunit)
MRPGINTVPSAPRSLTLGALSQADRCLIFATAQWPPRGRSGDFTEILRSPDGTTTIILGDVSGNGESAAAIAAWSRPLFQRHLEASCSLSRGLQSLNDALETELASDLFITAVVARIDVACRTVRVVSAGHLGPFARRRGAASASVARPSGPPLGIMRHRRYAEETLLELGAEDTLVFATDGVTDRLATAADCTGESRFLTELDHLPLRPSAICRRLLWSGCDAVATDATVLAVQIATRLSTSSPQESTGCVA